MELNAVDHACLSSGPSYQFEAQVTLWKALKDILGEDCRPGNMLT